MWSGFREQELLPSCHLHEAEAKMLNCPSCDYESPDNSRFCRQCGAPLLSERDLAEARTRNYGRQAAVVAAPSAPLPPSIGDAVAGETARYQQSLQAAPP